MPASLDMSKKRPRPTAQRAEEYDRLLLTKELEWLRTLTHLAPAGIYRTDARACCTYVNERWCELTGYAANLVIGQDWSVAVHPDDVPKMQAEWERCLEERIPYRVEHRFVQPNGRIVWALTQAAREVDGRGETIGHTGISTDITELHQIRETLQHSNRALEIRMKARSAELQRMARIVETIDDAVVSCDLAGRVQSWNRAAETIFGYSANEMIGQSVFLIVPDGELERAHATEQQMRNGEEVHQMETLAVSKAGEILEIAISGFPLHDEAENVVGTWAIMRDITARKRDERRLQRLSWKLMQAQDDERRRIARELHDSTAQVLAALSMNLAALARETPPLPEERRSQLLRDSLALAEQATGELRTTSYLLHPPLLDERGLRAALGWLSDGFSQRSGIKVTLEIAARMKRMPHEVETAMFRVAQESLHNVHRHSGSTVAQVRLEIIGDEVRLEIRDTGRGIPALRGDLIGVGIAGMRERLLQLGGTLELAAADPGTCVIARVPLRS